MKNVLTSFTGFLMIENIYLRPVYLLSGKAHIFYLFPFEAGIGVLQERDIRKIIGFFEFKTEKFIQEGMDFIIYDVETIAVSMPLSGHRIGCHKGMINVVDKDKITHRIELCFFENFSEGSQFVAEKRQQISKSN